MTNKVDFLTGQNRALNELQLTMVGAMYSDIDKMFEVLMKSGLDDNSLGFWIWDVKNKHTLYSPTFRALLQYGGEHDFPNVPKSWRNAIIKSDLKKVDKNFREHCRTKGKQRFIQNITYKKKYGGTLNVTSHGVTVAWNGKKPSIVIGVQMSPSGAFRTTIDLFHSMMDEDVRYFNMMDFEVGKRVRLIRGIEVQMIEKGYDEFSIKCWMEDGIELSLHHHSDYDEIFEVIEGYIIDLFKNIHIRKGQKYKFLAGVSHRPMAKGYTEILITGVKTK